MKASKFQLYGALFVLTAMLFLHSAAALADTYQIFDLGGPRQIYGIDSTGDVVIFDTGSSCDVHDNPCYDLFHQGTIISFSDKAPTLNYDDGTPCTPGLPPGFVVSVAICNGGREAFGEISPLVGLFTGSDPVADFVHGGTVEFIVMNSLGDIAWSSPEGDMEAYNLTSHVTPEPDTLALFSIGVLGMAGVVRRDGVRSD